MKPTQTVRLLCLSVFLASVGLAKDARADLIATTTLSFSSISFGVPFNITFDGLVIDWSTAVMTGVIDETNLTDLTYTLTNGGTAVYQDQTIINSVVQPIGGVNRLLTDLVFNFDITTIPAGFAPSDEFDNDLNSVQEIAGVGITYNIYDPGGSSTLSVVAFSDGVDIDSILAHPYTSSTTAIPEPSLLGLVGLGLFAAKRLSALSR